MEGLGFCVASEVLAGPCRCPCCPVPFCDPHHHSITSKPKWTRRLGEGREGRGGKGSKEKIEMALRFSVSLPFSSAAALFPRRSFHSSPRRARGFWEFLECGPSLLCKCGQWRRQTGRTNSLLNANTRMLYKTGILLNSRLPFVARISGRRF